MPIDARKYAYVITPSASPLGGFDARCLEISDLSCRGATATAALAACAKLAQEHVATMTDPPEPFSTRHYSGHIALRVPPSLHRTLVFEARRKGMSLNDLINRKLGVLAKRRA
jgi:predicted HicB family RNase H-like nuclease